MTQGPGGTPAKGVNVQQRLSLIYPAAPPEHEVSRIQAAVRSWLRGQGIQGEIRFSSGHGSDWWIEAIYSMTDHAAGPVVGAVALAAATGFWALVRRKAINGTNPVAQQETPPSEVGFPLPEDLAIGEASPSLSDATPKIRELNDAATLPGSPAPVCAIIEPCPGGLEYACVFRPDGPPFQMYGAPRDVAQAWRAVAGAGQLAELGKPPRTHGDHRAP